jgi:hypothetical protein
MGGIITSIGADDRKVTHLTKLCLGLSGAELYRLMRPLISDIAPTMGKAELETRLAQHFSQIGADAENAAVAAWAGGIK